LQGTRAELTINDGPQYEDTEGVSHEAILERVQAALTAEKLVDVHPTATNDLYQTGSAVRYKNWTVELPGVEPAIAERVFNRVKADLDATPLFPLASTIGGRVSSEMQMNALYATFISLLGVILYLWLRFQKVTYGLAAAVAVVHDVLVTIGVLALSLYFVNALPGVAAALKIDAFQIGLTIVAALLTILGYSLNDTIVTFDRLREIKGKSPRLTAEMVNQSVNQCLGRTLLTSLTVFMVVIILYIFGGEGIHSFAFAFLVGIIAGTYSTVYIAAPILLWLSGTSSSLAENEGVRAINRPASAISR
jgi:SecD/SecF fusion protein